MGAALCLNVAVAEDRRLKRLKVRAIEGDEVSAMYGMRMRSEERRAGRSDCAARWRCAGAWLAMESVDGVRGAAACFSPRDDRAKAMK